MNRESNIRLFHTNCMEFMAGVPNKYYDLAIVDPPYFSGPERRQFYGCKISSKGVKRVNYPISNAWDLPSDNYFNELFRISKNQIIWGCNYFKWHFGNGRIVWDKVNGDTSFSDAEIAFCSLHNSVRLFRYMWNGMMHGKSISDGHIMQGNKKLNEKRIHPTQKPVLLYSWLLQKYANFGDTIFDSHGGSMSIAIACYDLGFDIDICEIDTEHFNNGKARFEKHRTEQREIKRLGFAKSELSKINPTLF